MLRVFSGCIALLFFSVWIVQAFHSHNVSSGSTTDEECVYAADTCKICDYLAHKENKKFNISPVPVLAVPLSKAVTFLSRSYAGRYKFTLQGFTNKGPPFSLA